MKILDLFAGIGGFSLAAHWLGWETAAFVEKEPFCQKVLAKNFEGVPIYGDIFEFNGTGFRGAVDVVCGGFPCQPFSAAGKREGRNDERHLFPEMLRVIREVRPRWVVAENVRGLLSIENGRLFAEIVALLESEGFEVVTFCIPASALGAPHRRDRLWIVANNRKRIEKERGSDAVGRRIGGKSTVSGNVGASGGDASDTRCEHGGAGGDGGMEAGTSERPTRLFDAERCREDVADTDASGLQGGNAGTRRAGQSKARSGLRNVGHWSANWLDVALRTCVRRVDDGLPAELDESGSGKRGLAGDGRGDDASDTYGVRPRCTENGESLESGSDRDTQRADEMREPAGSDSARDFVADTDNAGSRTSPCGTDSNGTAQDGEIIAQFESGGHVADVADTASGRCKKLRAQQDAETDIGKCDFLGSRDNRNARLKALGNSIVPQIAFEIFKAIQEAESDE